MKVKSESEVAQVMSDPQRPHGLQPTRLLHLWDFSGRSTGVGCHCLLRIPSSTHLKFLDQANHLPPKTCPSSYVPLAQS